MLIAMLTVFLLGGGLMGGTLLNPDEVDVLDKRIESTLRDPARSAEAGEIVTELKTEIEAFDRIFVDAGRELEDIYRDHDAGSRPMLQTLERLNLEWYASQSRNTKLRDRLKETLTAEEWAAVFGASQAANPPGQLPLPKLGWRPAITAPECAQKFAGSERPGRCTAPMEIARHNW